MFEIRLAKIEDRESIQQIYVSAGRLQNGGSGGEDSDSWDQLIRAGGVLVAEEEDARVIGFGGIDVHALEQVKWLYLLSEHQGGGLGSKILRGLERIGWEAGLSSLRLHSAPAAVEFYRRNGYREVEASEQIGHDHEGVEMVKERVSDKL